MAIKNHHAIVKQLRAIAEAPRFVTFRAAALYAGGLRGSPEQYDRLEDVYNQLDAHAKGPMPGNTLQRLDRRPQSRARRAG